MSLKVYENKSYKDYQNDLQDQSRRGGSEGRSETGQQAEHYPSYQRNNKFLVLTMILLATSVVLGVQLFFVLSERNKHQSVPTMEIGTGLEVEIIRLPRYEDATGEALPVWECTDGSFVSSERNPGNCQIIDDGASKQGAGNKFFNPHTTFGQ